MEHLKCCSRQNVSLKLKEFSNKQTKAEESEQLCGNTEK
jgi:hypothetical protein